MTAFLTTWAAALFACGIGGAIERGRADALGAAIPPDGYTGRCVAIAAGVSAVLAAISTAVL